MLAITETLSIDEHAIHEDFVRASGPGGQNVNKVSTAVQLRFDVRNAGLPLEVQERLSGLAGKRMIDDGVLIIDARRFRTRERNRQDAQDRLIALVHKAAQCPKTRHPTRLSRAAKQRRIEAKRHRSRMKAQRRRDIGIDES